MRLSIWASALLSLCLPLRADEPPVEPDPAEAQHLSDLRTWRESGLPVMAVWNAGGYPLDWTVAQIEAGRRIIPAVSLPLTEFLSKPNRVEKLRLENGAGLARISDWRIGLALRDASQVSMRASMVRGTAADWQDTSLAVWRELADGTLDSKPQLDPFAPARLMREEGTRVGASEWMAALQQMAPDVPWIEYDDNNEAGKPGPGAYIVWDRAQGTRPETYTWRADEILPTSRENGNLRALAVKQAGAAARETRLVTIPALSAAQYADYFGGIAAAWTLYGGRPLRSNGYSAAWDASCFDGVGPSIYPTVKNPSLLSPEWLDRIREYQPIWIEQRARRPHVASRNLWITAKGRWVADAALAGVHRVIDPPLWQAWCELLLWSAHDRQPGAPSPAPVKLYEWRYHQDEPGQRFFDDGEVATLIALGRGDMVDLTNADYTLAAARAVDRVLDTGLLRDFWVRGTEATLSITSPAGTQGQALRDGGSYLVYLFDPREPTGERVEVVLDGVARSLAPLTRAGSYRLLAPPEEVDLVETVVDE